MAITSRVEYLRKDGKGFKTAEGQWYALGDHATTPPKGATITFSYNQRGRDKVVDTWTSSGGAPAHTATPTPSRKGGVFPIPALDGQRSIIRQNCVGNARELFVAEGMAKQMGIDVGSADGRETAAKEIIRLARIFEAYATGDLDQQQAQELAANAAAQTLANTDL